MHSCEVAPPTSELPGDQQKPAESGDENDDDTTMKPQLSEHSDEDTEMGEEVSP